MKRIAIIGPPCAGKSTLAGKLERIYNIKIYHLDRIFWERGWKAKPRDIRIDILQRLVGEKQWIIEGFYLKSSEPRLDAADTIIFLDMPPILCLHRLFERHRTQGKYSRRDIPLECADKLGLYSILKILFFELHGGRQLRRKLNTYGETKSILHFRSPEELKAFLAREEQAFTEQTNHRYVLKDSAPTGKKSQLVPVLSS